eukprot:TRINITY_DN558_c0_g1_i1.p1 TRINITY_DN558_c0_g1~~TRINITY_DN558_c0_g1_i1.p1  ORF type:complete len:222 (+),score=65.03 TRINITY_DN558_c0_g1_i1:119-784(+)
MATQRPDDIEGWQVVPPKKKVSQQQQFNRQQQSPKFEQARKSPQPQPKSPQPLNRSPKQPSKKPADPAKIPKNSNYSQNNSNPRTNNPNPNNSSQRRYGNNNNNNQNYRGKFANNSKNKSQSDNSKKLNSKFVVREEDWEFIETVKKQVTGFSEEDIHKALTDNGFDVDAVVKILNEKGKSAWSRIVKDNLVSQDTGAVPEPSYEPRPIKSNVTNNWDTDE